jgi:hypothetical protein
LRRWRDAVGIPTLARGNEKSKLNLLGLEDLAGFSMN